MLVLGEGFSRQGGPWLQWISQVFEGANSAAIEEGRHGRSQTVKFKSFSIKVLPASQLNVPEQLEFSAGTILVAEPDIPRPSRLRIVPAVDMTPSDLATLSGCFRFFHWTRILGMSEPGRDMSGESSQMKLGSIAHKFMENAARPSTAALKQAGLADLEAIFSSQDWRDLESANPERELPFLIHLRVDYKDCSIRGRIDAAVAGEVPRVIDYKYALWRDSAETAYHTQMTAYGLALMKALGTNRAISELWYLKPPMKIIRREHARDEAEEKLSGLLSRYLNALESGEWPKTERSYCDAVECGFRHRCWGET
jgi:hypothetical protein